MRRFARALVLAALAATPATLAAQAPGGSAPTGWRPIEVGLRAGYDNSSRGSVVGAQLRIPVLPSGVVEVIPNGDITFNPGLKEYQLAADAVWVTGGRRGGLYAGAGIATRNSIFSDGETEREWQSGWNLVAGLRTIANPRAQIPVGIQLEMRWIFVDDVYKPKVLTFGINVPLWGWGGRR